jgi:tRNA/rRNA methyltransferase/tRNA (cytidine32/uridine32-2'-O)-methyltransferase
MSVVVVLHEPQDLVNIAAVVRAMKNFGLRDLRLVRPAEYHPHRIEGIAHQTGDVLKRVAHFDTLDEALADSVLAVALTARGRSAKHNVLRPRDAAPEILATAARGTVALVLGREDRGLANEDLDRCHRAVTIPTNPAHASLNLAQAFCVMAYELFVQREDLPALKPPRKTAPPATHEDLRQLVEAAERALWAIEFFKTKNAELVMRTLRSVVHRVPLDRREAKLARAMCYEVVHFLERKGVT